eukprot:8442518-Pyramimonas_sp.AAC.1
MQVQAGKQIMQTAEGRGGGGDGAQRAAALVDHGGQAARRRPQRRGKAYALSSHTIGSLQRHMPSPLTRLVLFK